MNLDLIFLGGYWYFVWPAFIFSFAICYFLYIKTSKKFKIYEKMLLSETKPVNVAKIKSSKRKEILSENPIF
tara:strand:+ start:2066 stop:2281 length:216 start_codon:yes stop_codon:yes gene_type:complete